MQKSACSEHSLSSVWYSRGQPVIEALLVCGLKRAFASPWMCCLLFVALRGPYLTLLPNFEGWDIIFTGLGAAGVWRAEVLILLCQHKLRCSSGPAGAVGSGEVQASAGVDLTATGTLFKALSAEQCGWCCCLWVDLKVLLCEPSSLHASPFSLDVHVTPISSCSPDGERCPGADKTSWLGSSWSPRGPPSS